MADSQPNLGLRIKLSIERPPSDLVSVFAGVPTGNVCDANGRLGAMDYRIKPLHNDWSFAGTAITVYARPVDNMIVYKALDLARPGDVLVIANFAALSAAVIGDRVAAIAKAKGVVAIVTDGLVRDLTGLLDVDLPVFCRGLTPNAPWKDGPGTVNFPVVCGGVAVQPGDIVLGDADGVVVVSLADIETVAANLPAVFAKEQAMEAEIAAGRLISEDLDRELLAMGAQFVP